MLTDQNHGYADPEVPIGRQLPRNAAVRIGSGSWLGAGVVVLPGACIGRNVVIAAGSVVRGAVPDRCVAAGVPARVVRAYQPGHDWSPPPSSPPALVDAALGAAVLVDAAALADRGDGVAQSPNPPG